MEPAVDVQPATGRMGEPFELEGHRLAFLNWHFIRPCEFEWLDATRRNVTVVGNQGPEDAAFQQWERPFGIRLATQPAHHLGPVLEPEHPWESNRVLIHTLMRDKGCYRAWGSCGTARVNDDMSVVENFFCYLESDDGIHWRRPELGLVEFRGSRRNNLLPTVGGTVFLDPAAPEDERYKYVTIADIDRATLEEYLSGRPGAWDSRCLRPDAGPMGPEGRREGLIFAVTGAVSPDGLRWRTLPRPLVVEHSDTQNVAYYDTRLGKYVLYTRYWPFAPRSPRATEGSGIEWTLTRRSIGRSESEDFRHFPLSEPVLIPGPDFAPSETLYTNTRTHLPGAPEHHLMFSTVWDISSDTTRIVLFSSAEGKTWHRVPGDAVLATAPFGQWDGGCIMTSPNLVELPDGSFALPYAGYDVPHKYPRGQWHPRTGMAVWPHGRLVALEAPEYGQFSTFALMDPGRRLRLNGQTMRGGSIRVEVAGVDRRPLPGRSFEECQPIVGDHPRASVVWAGQDSLGHEPGQPLILRFQLNMAKLFSLEFE